MRIRIETAEPTATTIVVVAEASDIKPYQTQVEQRLAQKVKVAGFRVGQAPLHLAVKEIKPNLIQQEVLTKIVPAMVNQALSEEKIKPVLSPQIDVTKFVPFTDLEVRITAEHLGAMQLADYKSWSEQLPDMQATDDDIEQVLTRIRLDFADYEVVQRPCQLNDRVKLDFSGYIDQRLLRGSAATDYQLIVGRQSLIPGFEEELVGHKSGDKFEFNLRFPQDYQPAHLADQPVLFKVTIKQVEQVNLPDLDDTLAAKAGPFRTVADLQQFIIEQIKSDKQQQAQSAAEGRLVAKLAQASKLEIPQSLIDNEVKRLQEEHLADLQREGLELTQWLQEVKLTPEVHDQNIQTAALSRLRGGLVLQTISQTENIQVSDTELDEAFKQQTANMQLPADRVESVKQDLKARLLTQKTITHLMQTVYKPAEKDNSLPQKATSNGIINGTNKN